MQGKCSQEKHFVNLISFPSTPNLWPWLVLLYVLGEQWAGRHAPWCEAWFRGKKFVMEIVCAISEQNDVLAWNSWCENAGKSCYLIDFRHVPLTAGNTKCARFEQHNFSIFNIHNSCVDGQAKKRPLCDMYRAFSYEYVMNFSWICLHSGPANN